MPGTILIGYDVEVLDADSAEDTRRFLDVASALHRRLGVPFTMFTCGKTLELSPEHFIRVRDDLGGLVDIQQHTYSHVRLKAVFWENEREKKYFPGGTLEEIARDVARAQDAHEKILGARPKGICGPYCYWRGLSDRADVLSILHGLGIRFTRTFGRNQWDWQPLDHAVQPFWYREQGFGDVLETPLQGWQDCQLRDEIGWKNLDRFLDFLIKSLDEVADHDLVWSAGFHDWSSIREDPDMSVILRFLERALERGVEFLTHRDFYRNQKALKEKT